MREQLVRDYDNVFMGQMINESHLIVKFNENESPIITIYRLKNILSYMIKVKTYILYSLNIHNRLWIISHLYDSTVFFMTAENFPQTRKKHPKSALY